MCRSSIVILVLAAVLLTDNRVYATHENQAIADNDVDIAVPINYEDVDLQLLDETGKRESLFYTVGECVPHGGICYSLFQPFKPCCPDTHCYCTIVYCYCSDNVSTKDKNRILTQPQADN